MQKEALVAISGGPVWRLVSDEGPYLNGTDLAPFPLAFFTAGMQFSFVSEVLAAARSAAITVRAIELECDNYYSMQGSFLRGDALGGAMPARLSVRVEANTDAPGLASLVRRAAANCPAQRLMRRALKNRFALRIKGRTVALPALDSAPRVAPDASTAFDSLRPLPGAGDIVTKLETAKPVRGVTGGVGSSLQAEQKRILHVRGHARWLGAGRTETRIELFQPIGSTFRLVSDDLRERGGEESAPPPLAYLCAGVGFCFMTQIGRLAHIHKLPMDRYAIVQDCRFDCASDDAGEGPPDAVSPFDTYVEVQAELGENTAAELVRMAERTCFLHAAMRGVYPSEISTVPAGLPPALGGADV